MRRELLAGGDYVAGGWKGILTFADSAEDKTVKANLKMKEKAEENLSIFGVGGAKSRVALLKKSVNDLLFPAYKFFTYFQVGRFALNVNHRTVMQDTIRDCGGNGYIGKELIPLEEGLVGGKDSGGFLIAPGDELEEQVRARMSMGR